MLLSDNSDEWRKDTMANEINYCMHDDCLLPAIILKEVKSGDMGKYGHL